MYLFIIVAIIILRETKKEAYIQITEETFRSAKALS